jgi:hypothetical protein
VIYRGRDGAFDASFRWQLITRQAAAAGGLSGRGRFDIVPERKTSLCGRM